MNHRIVKNTKQYFKPIVAFMAMLIITVIGVQISAPKAGAVGYSYLNGEFEYRVKSGNVQCLSNGIIGLKINALNGKTNNAQLKIEVSKCDGGAFVKDGNFTILVDGQPNGTTKVKKGSKVVTVTLQPRSPGEHKYQIDYRSDDDSRNTPKLSGVVKVEGWGRCWCTDYIYQRFYPMKGTVPDANGFADYLKKNGFKEIKPADVKEGDVAVIPPGVGEAPPAGHVGIIKKYDPKSGKFTLRQGGSRTDKWFDDWYCYNIRDVEWGGHSSIKYFRK